MTLLNALQGVFLSPVLHAAGWGFASSFSLCVLLVLTKRWHGSLSMDFTDGVQKFHTAPTPRIGGIPIVLGLVVTWFKAPPDVQALLTPILFAGMPAFLFGVAEDITKRVGVMQRLLATMASGLLAWWITGQSISGVDLWGVDWLLGITFVSVLFTAFAVGGVANAINIIDGFNGLASTIAGMFAAFPFIAFMENVGLVILTGCGADEIVSPGTGGNVIINNPAPTPAPTPLTSGSANGRSPAAALTPDDRLARIHHCSGDDRAGDDRATGEHGNVLQHGFAPIAETGSLHRTGLDRAAHGVDDQRGQGVTVDVFGNHQQRLPALDHLFQQGQQILQGRQALVAQQDQHAVEQGQRQQDRGLKQNGFLRDRQGLHSGRRRNERRRAMRHPRRRCSGVASFGGQSQGTRVASDCQGLSQPPPFV